MPTPRLIISGYIGDSDPMLEAMGINEEHTSASMVRDWLEQHKTANEIEVEIRSNGGSVTQGFMIYDLLVTSRKRVTTIGFNVKSIATVIFMAGSVRKMAENGEFLIHNPWIDPASLGPSNADMLQKVADDMRQEEDRLFNFYTSKLNINDKEGKDLKKLMDKDSNMPITDVLDWGFATEILSAQNAYASSGIKVFAYSDSILKTIKENSMENKEAKNALAEVKAFIKDIFKANKLIKNASVTLEDGTTKIYYDGELAVDTAVFSDEAMTTPAPDGDHKTDNGDIITVANGKVTAITQVQADETAALKEQITTLTNEKNKLVEDAKTKDAEIATLKSNIEAISKKIDEFEPAHISVEPEDKNKVTIQAFSKNKKEDEESPFDGFKINAAKRYGQKTK